MYVPIQNDRVVSLPQHWAWEGGLHVAGSEEGYCDDSSNGLLQFAGKSRYWVETHWLYRCAQQKVPSLWEPCTEVTDWEIIGSTKKQYQNPGLCAFKAEGEWIRTYHTPFLGRMPHLLDSSCLLGCDPECGHGTWPLFLLSSHLAFPMMTPRYLNVHASYLRQMCCSRVHLLAWPGSNLIFDTVLTHRFWTQTSLALSSFNTFVVFAIFLWQLYLIFCYPTSFTFSFGLILAKIHKITDLMSQLFVCLIHAKIYLVQPLILLGNLVHVQPLESFHIISGMCHMLETL